MNEIIAASKSNHMAYANMKKDYTALVFIYARKLPKVKSADFTVTWYCKDRRKDKDGILAGLKFIFDGLVEAKIIPNDGWKEIGDVTHKFEVDKERPRVEVNILEVAHHGR